mgnify:CR=1 FL=1
MLHLIHFILHWQKYLFRFFMALLMLMLMIKNNRFHKFLRTVFYLPYVCSMTAISIMWSMLLNTNYGMLPYLFKQIGVDFPNVLTSTTWAMPVVILITVWKNFGYTLTLLSAAALGVSNSLYEAAEMDGATGFQKFYICNDSWNQTDYLIFVLLQHWLPLFRFLIRYMLWLKGGPLYKTETLVSYIYNQGFQVAPYDLGYASSIAVYLFLMVAIITFVLRRFVLNRGTEEWKIKKIKVNEIVGTAVTVFNCCVDFISFDLVVGFIFKSDADVIKCRQYFFQHNGWRHNINM